MPIRGPFIPIPGTCKLAFLGHDTATNRPVDMILHANCGVSPTAGTLTNIGNAAATWWGTARGNCVNTFFLDTIEVTDLNDVHGPQVTVSVGSPGTGGAGSPAICAVTEFKTNARGRSFEGRAYWPCPAGDYSTTTLALTTIFQGSQDTNWGNLNAALIALSPSSNLVIASRKLHLGTGVSSFHTRSLVGRIRRREFG